MQTESFDKHFDRLSLVKLVKQGGRRHRSLLRKRGYREVRGMSYYMMT